MMPARVTPTVLQRLPLAGNVDTIHIMLHVTVRHRCALRFFFKFSPL